MNIYIHFAAEISLILITNALLNTSGVRIDRIMASKDVCVLTLATCNAMTLHGKIDGADLIE